MSQTQKTNLPSIWSTLLVTFLIVILALFLLALATFLVASLFVGVGWVMTLIFPLTLYV